MSLDYYKNKTVLVTGHTGFKGAWLCAWLKTLGAKVIGISLAPPNDRPSLFETANIADEMVSVIADIRDINAVSKVFNENNPEIVFHLAAQSLVRPSYSDPITTYATNVLGTVHIIEAARQCSSVKTALVITSDKCYQNNEWHWGYRENDRLGGKDPYSASKSCAELVVKSYQESILCLDKNPILLASARGGNVIGAGDWSEDRLIPDIIRAITQKETITLRNPLSIRPWQHVLELLYGYLTLVESLGVDGEKFVGAWNFGPNEGSEINVELLTKKILQEWNDNSIKIEVHRAKLKEANFLRLDSSKAKNLLNWQPSLNIDKTIALTVEGYKTFVTQPKTMGDLLVRQINRYVSGVK